MRPFGPIARDASSLAPRLAGHLPAASAGHPLADPTSRRLREKPNGWGGIRTHERLSPLPVFKVGEAPPETVGKNSPENSDEKLLKPFPPGRAASGASGETETNRDTTSQIETTHRTSQRQVATCLSRIDSNGEVFSSSHPCPSAHRVRAPRVAWPPRCRAASITAMARASGGWGEGRRLAIMGCPRELTASLRRRWQASTSSPGRPSSPKGERFPKAASRI